MYIDLILFINIDNNFTEIGINKLCNTLRLLKNLKSISFYGFNISNYNSLSNKLQNNNLIITI